MNKTWTGAAALALTLATTPAWADLDATVYAGWWRDGVLYGTSGDISFDASAAIGSFVDPNVDHWNGSIYHRWAPYGRDEFYSVRWTGYLKTPTAGDYQFRVTSDDGAQLLLGGSKVVDAPELQWYATTTSQTLTLAATTTALELRFYENAVYDGIRLEWLTPGAADWAVIPASALVTTVPEPASWALLLGGAALIGTRLRRRAD